MTAMSDETDRFSEKLDEVIAECIQAEEAGEPVDRDTLLAAHPDLADNLREFFADRDRLRQLAGGMKGWSRQRAFVPPKVRYFGDYELLDTEPVSPRLLNPRGSGTARHSAGDVSRRPTRSSSPSGRAGLSRGIDASDCKLSHTRVMWRFENGRSVLVAYEVFRHGNQFGKPRGALGRGEFGIEVIVALAYQVYCLGLSIDKACSVMAFFQQLKLRKSQADALLNRLAAAWEGEFDHLCTLLANSAVVHADETSWSINSVWATKSRMAMTRKMITAGSVTCTLGERVLIRPIVLVLSETVLVLVLVLEGMARKQRSSTSTAMLSTSTSTRWCGSHKPDEHDGAPERVFRLVVK
jgi:hypothetical protein